MIEVDIEEVIVCFICSVELVECVGFSGVQIYVVYGYLFSQFLLLLFNCCDDCWGGSLYNCVCLLLEIVQGVCVIVLFMFVVVVKFNFVDFQCGGFLFEDVCVVVEMLVLFGVDLVELFGGSYEVLVMIGVVCDQCSLVCEVYFFEFVCEIVMVVMMLLMVIGGICCCVVVDQVFDSGVVMVGIVIVLVIELDLLYCWQQGCDLVLILCIIDWCGKLLVVSVYMVVVKYQLMWLSRFWFMVLGVLFVWVLLLVQVVVKC